VIIAGKEIQEGKRKGKRKEKDFFFQLSC